MESKRLALLIGISKYEYANSLKNPVNDVSSMSKTLQRLGFEVITLTDVEYKTFKLALNDFAEKLNEYDVGLFYFAGHGIQVKGINYLIAADSNPKSENQVEFDCINANLVLSLMEDAKNKINLIFLDACRNNPFERLWHRSPSVSGLSYMSAPYGTLIAYSTAPDKTALDGQGLNSPYTSALIHEIISPKLTIIQVLQKVRSNLIKETDGEQVPWESTSLINDFIFNDDRYFSISTFCNSILYSSNDNVFNTLKLNIWSVTRIVHSGSPLNQIDKDEGVIEVYFKKGLNYFDVFQNIEVKIKKNGERIYTLFTVTKNPDEVIRISKELYRTLGVGLYDDRRHSSFREEDKIKNLAKGKAKSDLDEIFTIWTFNNISFSLRYLIKPNYGLFNFDISIKPQKNIINKTIIELLNNDYDALLDSAIKIRKEEKENGFFEDYLVLLEDKEFEYFDTATIRMFSEHDDNTMLQVLC